MSMSDAPAGNRTAGNRTAGGQATGGQAAGGQSERRWRVLLSPRWMSWHLFAVVAFVGMWWLGDWQFRRAMTGNGLSWAYTFEWPIFAIFGAVFWVKTVRDELRPPRPAEKAKVVLPAGVAAGGASAAPA